MITYIALGIFLVGALGLAFVFVAVSQAARQGPAPHSAVAARAYRLRLFWFFALGGLLMVAFLAGLPFVPYANHRLAPGLVAMHASVMASQYSWNVEGNLTTGGNVDFAVTSVDVNHGFGIYDSSGHLVGQVQAMPGYTNHLVIQFGEPGDYMVRCLEYCGPGHSAMYMKIHVGTCQSGCCC